MYQKQQATAGQGGMVYTKDEDLYWKIRSCADRGKPFGIENPRGNVRASLNCNMDELHACIGRVQLRKLPTLVSYAQALGTTLAQKCEKELQHFRLVTEPEWGDNTFWFLFVKVDLNSLKIGIDQIIAALKQEGINGCGLYNHVPMRMPWAVDRYGACSELPNCTQVVHSHIRLGFNEQYTEQEVDDLVLALKKIEGEYAR